MSEQSSELRRIIPTVDEAVKASVKNRDDFEKAALKKGYDFPESKFIKWWPLAYEGEVPRVFTEYYESRFMEPK